MGDENQPSFIDGPNGRIAVRRIDADARGAGRPTIVWLGGFRSDMTGTKAQALSDWSAGQGRSFVRFDYSGHGASDGAFEDGCIGDWLADAQAVIAAHTNGPLVLVGSSMGGWIATLLALRALDRLAGAVFIAPAPDFTERLMWPALSPAQRDEILSSGRLEAPSEYDDEPTVITRRLIEDGRRHLVMDGPIAIDAPVRILQGMADPDVPHAHALAFAERLTSRDVLVTLTKSGDHRLSTPADLQRLTDTVDAIG